MARSIEFTKAELRTRLGVEETDMWIDVALKLLERIEVLEKELRLRHDQGQDGPNDD
jgi:hypothetical protein